MSKARVHVYISGHVQGVFFRDHTRRQALANGVAGWVRNLWDGRVEAVFEGDEEAVQRMIAWCWQGPPNAYVTDVEVHDEPTGGDLRGFSIRW